MKKLVLSFAMLLAAFAVRGDDKVVEAVGMGKTYRAAINEALVSALEQTEGVTLSAAELAAMSENSLAVNSSEGDFDKTQFNDSLNKDIAKRTSGKINGYEVLSSDFDSSAKNYTVTLNVRLPGAYTVGLDPANRRRMALAPMRVSSGSTISWYGYTTAANAWTKSFGSKLAERMTSSRKFTMLDRDFDAEIDAELTRLAAPNASKGDIGRLNQKLATDYLIVGSVKFSKVLPPPVNPYTKKLMPATSQIFAELSYRVLLAPTGQLKFADSIKLDAVDFDATTLDDFIAETAETAAAEVSERILSSILPYEIVAVTKTGTIVIGEGGKSLKKGDVLEVYSLDEVVCDTRTGEELDQIEEVVGLVKVTRVTDKLAYAKIIEGDKADMPVGSRLRRPVAEAEDEAEEEAAEPASVIKAGANGGVILPF